MSFNTDFENIISWNGQNDTGKDVRLKWQRNFQIIADYFKNVDSNFDDITSKFEEIETNFLSGDKDAAIKAIFDFTKGLKINGKSLADIIISTDSTEASDNNIFTALKTLNTFLRKDKEETTEFLVHLLGGIITNSIKSTDFATGQLGSGFTLYNQDGKSYMEIDELLVRVKAVFTSLEIRKLNYVGDNMLFTSAGCKISRVEETDKTYKCYFMSDDGTTATTNDFVVGDQVRCQTFNIKAGKYTNVSNKYYWRYVSAVGDGYIELSKTDCDANSDAPVAGDALVQLGNRNDSTRQNAIMLEVSGENAPAMIQYAGICGYSLSGKDTTVISPSGNKFVAKSFAIQVGDSIVKIPAEKGEWVKDTAYSYYDRVSHNGSLWLCIIPEGRTTTDEPTDNSNSWQKQVSKGNDGETGAQGEKGDTGNTGAKGDTGATGAKGDDGFMCTLSPESVTLNDDESGNITNLSLAITTVKLLKGIAVITPTIIVSATSGCSATISSNTVVITAIPQNTKQGYVDILITSGSFNVTKRFSFQVIDYTVTKTIALNTANGALSLKADQKTVDDMGKTVDQNTADISANAKAITLKMNSGDFESMIDQHANKINMTVKSQVDNAINGVQVGGVNLFGFNKGTTYDYHSPIIDRGINGFEFDTGNSGAGILLRIHGIGFNGIGGNFVVSAYMKASAAYILNMNLCDYGATENGGNISLTTDYQRIILHYPNVQNYTDANSYNGFLDFESNAGTGITIYVKDLMIERGTESSLSWSAAPEDINSDIAQRPTTDQIKSSLTIDTDGISLLGKKILLGGMITFQSLDSGAQKKITDAQGTADAAADSAKTANDGLGSLKNSLGGLAYESDVQKAMEDKGLISGGYLKMSLIDVTKVVAAGISAQTIDAQNATFKNLNVQNGKFTGELDGVTGSFQNLNCVGGNGKAIGGIAFDQTGIWINGCDFYHQGTYNNRTLRYYSANIFCRGAFGHSSKAVAVVSGNIIRFYVNGYGQGDYVQGALKTYTYNGYNFYKIPVSPTSDGYSQGSFTYQSCYGNASYGDVNGFQVDVVIIDNGSLSLPYYMLVYASQAKEVTVFNRNNGQDVVLAVVNGYRARLPGGTAAHYLYWVDGDNGAMNMDIPGSGWMTVGYNDNNW